MFFTAFIFSFKNNILSQNLIINSSFENYNLLYCNGAGFDLTNWYSIGSPDYFNSFCTASSGGSIPKNDFGYSYSKSGNAYAGILGYYKPYETKEYIQQHIGNPLIGGKSYYVSFYLSGSDRFTMSIKNIGAYISVIQPTTVVSNTYIPATPQVENQTGFLTDTTGWTKIEGYFKAQGGEQYITIGNFNSNANTDTLYTGSSNPALGNPDGAYYYIDSVSLYDSLDYALITNIKQLENEIKVNLYPNPNIGNFKLEYHITKEAEFVITDIRGRLASQYTLLASQNSLLIKEEELNAGIYFYSIKMNGSIIKNDKLIIIK
jgi:hypothetical protein